MRLLDNQLREKLLREPDLILKNAVRHARELQRQIEGEKKSVGTLNTTPKQISFHRGRQDAALPLRKCKACNESDYIAKCCPNSENNSHHQSEHRQSKEWTGNAG